MLPSVIDFGTGVIIGGLALSACWGWLWLVVATIGFARGACRLRVMTNSLAVAVIPLVLGSGLLWLRAEAFSHAAFVIGTFMTPLLLIGLSLRRAPDGRRAGHHMTEGIRHLRDELLGTHHDCGGCGQDHGVDRAGGCT
ncbi:MAG TPA: hypothetical protein VJR03_10760 [Nitrospira sp.]|nr:hypothetical protein [Nitrospira sp.]